MSQPSLLSLCSPYTSLINQKNCKVTLGFMINKVFVSRLHFCPYSHALTHPHECCLFPWGSTVNLNIIISYNGQKKKKKIVFTKNHHCIQTETLITTETLLYQFEIKCIRLDQSHTQSHSHTHNHTHEKPMETFYISGFSLIFQSTALYQPAVA